MQRYDVYMTSRQSRCNVMKFLQRRINVDVRRIDFNATLHKRHVPTEQLDVQI